MRVSVRCATIPGETSRGRMQGRLRWSVIEPARSGDPRTGSGQHTHRNARCAWPQAGWEVPEEWLYTR